jgi:ribosomal protein L33
LLKYVHKKSLINNYTQWWNTENISLRLEAKKDCLHHYFYSVLYWDLNQCYKARTKV